MVLLVGFSGLILNWPLVPGLAVTGPRWLPGFTGDDVAVWIWFVYAGVAMSLATAAVYTLQALKSVRDARSAAKGERR